MGNNKKVHLVPGDGCGVGGCLAAAHHEAAGVPGGAGDHWAARHHPATRGAAPEVEGETPRREVLVVCHLKHYLSDNEPCMKTPGIMLGLLFVKDNF